METKTEFSSMEPAEILKRVAYHEAGHAMMAFILGKRFRYITIVPRNDVLGHIPMNWGKAIRILEEPIDRYDRKELWKARKILETEILIRIAGQVSETIHFDQSLQSLFDDVPNEMVDAKGIALHITKNEQECMAYLRWLISHTESLLRDPLWGAGLISLASHLVEAQRLTYNEAISAIGCGIQPVIDNLLQSTLPVR